VPLHVHTTIPIVRRATKWHNQSRHGRDRDAGGSQARPHLCAQATHRALLEVAARGEEQRREEGQHGRGQHHGNVRAGEEHDAMVRPVGLSGVRPVVGMGELRMVGWWCL